MGVRFRILRNREGNKTIWKRSAAPRFNGYGCVWFSNGQHGQTSLRNFKGYITNIIQWHVKIWFLYKPSLRYNHISSVVAFWRKDVPTAFGPWSWFWEVKSQRAYNFSAYLSMLHDEILNVSDAHQISHKSSKPWGCFIWQLKTRCLKQDKSYSTGPTFQSHWQKGRNYTTGMYLGLIDVNNLIILLQIHDFRDFLKFMLQYL